MSHNAQTLIVGIGSCFGDDQLGVIVAQQLAPRLPGCQILSLRSSLDIGNYLTGVQRLHIVDACRGLGVPGEIFRYDWTADALTATQFCGTHDLGLIAALQLTQRLQGLPGSVTIWCIEVSDDAQFGPDSMNSSLSPDVASAAKELTERIAMEILDHPARDRESMRHA